MNLTWITPDKPALVLAPMEGVTDACMRELLTERGGFSFCVSEFLRISQSVLPPRTYLDHVPELKTACKTASGVPIQIQLLGGDEERLALSAIRAVELGARAIDLNFGCPAPTVNRHDGGASLLRYPKRIEGIVAAVRKAVPSHVPVSAKIRLGWESMSDVYDNAQAATQGGASWLTIHARTKFQGYAPPAYWKYIGEVRHQIGIPVVANGDIWTREDYLKCRAETDCIHFMIGRGALADPGLPHAIAQHLGIEVPGVPAPYPQGTDPKDWEAILSRFSEVSAPSARDTQYTARRIKQWIGFANMRKSQPWMIELKRTSSLEEIFSLLGDYRSYQNAKRNNPGERSV
ncbi:MAG: tRNA-dihydrouridine synthase family protein [Bdellovibrionia bacterium]